MAGRRRRGQLFELYVAVYGDQAEAALQTLRFDLLREMSHESGSVWAKEETSAGLRCLSHAVELAHGAILFVVSSKDTLRAALVKDDDNDGIKTRIVITLYVVVYLIIMSSWSYPQNTKISLCRV